MSSDRSTNYSFLQQRHRNCQSCPESLCLSMPTNGMTSIFGDAVCRCYLPFVKTIFRGLVCENNLRARKSVSYGSPGERRAHFLIRSWPAGFCSCNLTLLET